MKIFNLLIGICLSIPAYSQSFNLKGKIIDEQKESIPFANIALYHLSDTVNIVKGSASDLLGNYSFKSVESGDYITDLIYRIQNKVYSCHYRQGCGAECHS